MTFAQLNMNQTLLKAITKGGYTEPTPIQAAAIPQILEGKDLLGSAQTGTGKTAAFALPIIQKIQEMPHSARRKQPVALILAPTRELALQIRDSFRTYALNSAIKVAAIYGGVPKRNQIQALKRGVDVIVATPGRLLDLMEMNVIRLDSIAYYVLDEADRMLDMGFIPDVKRITDRLPVKHQTMFFSATLPNSILALAKTMLDQPVRVTVSKDSTPLETINQSIYFVKKPNKPALLSDILTGPSVTSALVFVRTKQGANRLSKMLSDAGLDVDAIHGNKSQAQRQQTLNNFKQNKTRILIATDVASRGIDIDALSHVINFDMPETPETYLHRIGRTARAGRHGHSLSFCSPEETHLLKAIQNHIAMTIPVQGDHPFSIKNQPKHVQAKQTTHHKKTYVRFDGSAKRKSKPSFHSPSFKKSKSSQKSHASRRHALHAS